MSVKPFRSDLSWRWQIFSGRPLLVTDGGGAMVVLAGAYQSPIQTRDLETGKLRTIDPSDYVAKVIAAAPDVHRHAQALIHGIDIGVIRIKPMEDDVAKVLAGLRLALAQSGAA